MSSKVINFEIFDLQCGKNTDNAVVLREKNSDRKIYIPISDYEFQYIKDIILGKHCISYIESLSQNFLITKNEIIIDNNSIKSLLTLADEESGATRDIILSPIEPLIFCNKNGIDIIAEEKVSIYIRNLKFKAEREIKEETPIEIVDKKNISKNIEQYGSLNLEIDPQSEQVHIAENNECKMYDSRYDFEEVQNKDTSFKDFEINTENVKRMSSSDLVEILKVCLNEYQYENVIIIDEELKSRKLNVWHGICKDDFL